MRELFPLKDVLLLLLFICVSLIIIEAIFVRLFGASLGFWLDLVFICFEGFRFKDVPDPFILLFGELLESDNFLLWWERNPLFVRRIGCYDGCFFAAVEVSIVLISWKNFIYSLVFGIGVSIFYPRNSLSPLSTNFFFFF